MNRLHIHLKTPDLDASVTYYSALFGKAPDVKKPDYVKWMLDDPSANVSVTRATAATGVDHVGVQFERLDDMHDANKRLLNAAARTKEEASAVCCYAKSEKYWSQSPESAVWELFHTHGENETYGADRRDTLLEPVGEACGMSAGA